MEATKSFVEKTHHKIYVKDACGNVLVYYKKTKRRQKRRLKTAVVRPFLVALKAEFSLHMGCEAL